MGRADLSASPLDFDYDKVEREMVKHDVHPEVMSRVLDADRCDDCGEPVPIGAWPFCPHGKGAAYAFKMGFKMATQGWTRRER